MTKHSQNSQIGVASSGVLLALIALCLWPLEAQADDALSKRLVAVNNDISNWQMPQAKAALDQLDADGGAEDPAYLITRARYVFFSGDYKGALDYADQAIANANDPEETAGFVAFRELVEKSWETTKDYKVFTSPQGHFEIRVPPGKDEIVVPYAFQTLDLAYDAFAQQFGFRPPTPIVVEMYPTAATLAHVTFLTEEQIKTSGTIALCKYNRLMFTSPKALAKGYGWRDTMSHELAHMVITIKSNNTIPIWMHEGLAKYNERLWRFDPAQHHTMQPHSENYLKKGVEKNELVTFEQMHPSMALLPSQEATGLAFAEVHTVMEYLRSKKGNGVFAQILVLMREHDDAPKVIEILMGVSFAQFERDWKKYLRSRPSRAFDEDFVHVDKLTFVEDAKKSDILELGKKEAEDLVHLGELLQARERYGAALVEYRKARDLVGNRNPVLQKRLGRTLITLRRYQEAIDVLAASLEYYPNYHDSHALLGEALHLLGRNEEAEVHMIEAVGINPFDPSPHRILADIYAASGRDELAARARAHAQMAGG